MNTTRRTFMIAAAHVVGAAVLKKAPEPHRPHSAVNWTTWKGLAAGTEPDVNPLKGFMPFALKPNESPDWWADPSFPHSMEWFHLPVKAIVKGPGSYDYEALETWLDAVASRRHQAALRFYLDYPKLSSGVPDYLLGSGGIEQRKYNSHGNNGVSFSPNYDDPRIVTLMTEFIGSLGRKYDGDPRIAYLTLGLVGFWGEWHTWTPNEDTANWMPSEATQRAVFEAYEASFTRTLLLARYPSNLNLGKPFGFHDDSFAYATLPGTNWHFLGLLKAHNALDVWRTRPIGGELYPDIQKDIFSDPPCPGPREPGRDYNFTDSVTQTHVSWLGNQTAWYPGYSGADRERAIAASKSMGYSLRATRYRNAIDAPSRTLKVELDVTNQGVAPFYADWPCEFSLRAADGSLRTGKADRSVQGILPTQSATLAATIAVNGLRSGRYTLLMRVVNPLSNGLPLRFANAAQDATTEGYLTLGHVDIP